MFPSALTVDRFFVGSPLTDRRSGRAPTPSTKPVAGDGRPRNRLLAALSAPDRAHVEAHLELVELRQRDVLFDAGERIDHVYFPETVVVSLVSWLEDGGSVEVGTTGCEGVAGLPVFLGDAVSPVRAIAQIPGRARRLSADLFTDLTARSADLHRLMLRYTHAFLTQVAQTAACNAAHLVEERCARWLLMTHDRVDGDEFPLTHEFLAFMLGVRRAGVSAVMRLLSDARVIRYDRGNVAIVNRAALERHACECYRVVRAQYERLLPSGT